jgi:hypothetical protein
LLILGLAAVPASAWPGRKKDTDQTKKTKADKKKKGQAAPKPPEIPQMGEEQKTEHVLNRLGYGPRPGDIERVQQIGVQAYIEQQLHPERIDDHAVDTRLEPLNTLQMSNEEIATTYMQPNEIRKLQQAVKAGQPLPPRARALYQRVSREMPELLDATDPEKTMGRLTPEQRQYVQMHSPQRLTLELQDQKLLRAVYSQRQLQEQMVDFWMNHFNVFMAKGADRWLETSYERDAIRPNAMGKFRDLLLATARHPAMLFQGLPFSLTLLAIHEFDTLQYLLGRVCRVFGWLRRLEVSACITCEGAEGLHLSFGANSETVGARSEVDRKRITPVPE